MGFFSSSTPATPATSATSATSAAAPAKAKMQQVYTAADITDFEVFQLGQVADDHALRWFWNNACIVRGPLHEKPLVHFPTGQYDSEPDQVIPVSAKGGVKISANQRTTFENDITPLRIKGDIIGDEVTAEVGLTLSPSVYYKLGDLTGDFSKGPVIYEIPDNPLYKGKIELHRPQEGDEFSALGFGSFLAKVDWAGLGLQVANAVLPLLKH